HLSGLQFERQHFVTQTVCCAQHPAKHMLGVQFQDQEGDESKAPGWPGQTCRVGFDFAYLKSIGQSLKFKVQSSKFEVQSLKFEVQSSKFKVQSLKFEVQSSKFK